MDSLKVKIEQANETLRTALEERKAVAAELGMLVAEEVQLEASIKVKEATEIMALGSDGKNQICEVNGKVIALTNDKLRDAYRRLSTLELRDRRAICQSKIALCREQLSKVQMTLLTYAPLIESYKLLHTIELAEQSVKA